MKLIIKIGLITLLFLIKYQSADAEVSSAISSYTSSAIEHHPATSTDDSTLGALAFTNSLLTGQQQMLVKLTPDDFRIRRAEELQQNFLKILIGYFSLREETLVTDHAKIFPSNPIHCVSPACHYFVFTLRRILI
ncbi:MAG: hypothetical protein LUI85_10475 [Bacteroides sp.]|nr:hypothetical protein [Bacteroides sp.]